MNCPECSTKMQRNGKRNNRQQWRCPSCKHALREGEGKIGRPKSSPAELSADQAKTLERYRKALIEIRDLNCWHVTDHFSYCQMKAEEALSEDN